MSKRRLDGLFAEAQPAGHLLLRELLNPPQPQDFTTTRRQRVECCYQRSQVLACAVGQVRHARRGLLFDGDCLQLGLNLLDLLLGNLRDEHGHRRHRHHREPAIL